MSKKNRSGFAVLERRLLDSPSFRDLTKTAMLVLLDFLSMCRYENRNVGKRKERTLINNGELTYTFDMAEKKGIPRASFGRAIRELIEHGFLSIREQGFGLYRSANRYALDERWVDWNTERFVEVKKPPPRIRAGFRKGHELFGSKATACISSTADDNGSSTADDNGSHKQVS